MDDGKIWEKEISITPTKTGKEQRVEFVLYRADETEPLDRVWFWVDVE